MKRRMAALCIWAVLLALLPAGERTSVSAGGGAVVKLPEEPRLVALTFDDGPRASTTGRLLEGLALREVPATFFLLGHRIQGNEELIRTMKADGHQIGVHTYDHVLVSQLTRGEFEDQMDRTRRLLTEILGPGEYWLRPPYGLVDETAAKLADGPLILWSVDPEDWKDRNVERIVNAVTQRAEDGAVILMHDTYESSVDGALQIVDRLLEEGYCFVTVEQLMALRGVEPEAGVSYRSFPPGA